MGKHLSNFELGRISAFNRSGWGAKRISNELKRSVNTIKHALQRMKKLNTYKRSVGSGRPRKTSERESRMIVRQATTNCFLSAEKIRCNLKIKYLISKTTVKRRIHDKGIRGYAARKPFVNEVQRKRRLKWAIAHKDWSVEQWRNVLFSDESLFVMKWKGRQMVWRRRGCRFDPKYLNGSLKHDKKIMVWGCFSAFGVGEFYKIDGIMNASKYRQILINHMRPSAEKIFKDKSFIFQHDNDPKHTNTSNEVKNYLKNRKINVLDWPSQSPDLNPIENLWKELNFRTKSRKVNTEEELYEVLPKEWNTIDSSFLQKLVDSMPDRCQDVIKNKGMPINY